VIASATVRPQNWIEFCVDRPDLLPSISHFTFHFHNENVLTPLKLITLALLEGNQHVQNIANAYLRNEHFGLAKFMHTFLFSSESLVRQQSAEFISRLYNYCEDKETVLKTVVEICDSVSAYGGNAREYMTMITKLMSGISEEVRHT
jgi:hypothetical protein